MLDDVFILRPEASRSVSWFRPSLVDGTPPKARAGHSANLIPSDSSHADHLQRVLIFGGGDGEEYLNDVHVLDVDEEKCTIRWRSVATLGVSPPPRSRHSAVLVGSQLFVLGGVGAGGSVFGDLFVLDLVSFSWSSAVAHGAHIPRWGHTAVALSLLSAQPSHIVVFGGNDGVSMVNSTWLLALATMEWAELPNLHCPSPRAGHTAAVVRLVLPSSETVPHLLVFGGGDGAKVFNDVCLLPLHQQPTAASWTRPHIKGIAPAARCAHTACNLQGRLYVFGGGDSSRRFKDIYVLDIASLMMSVLHVPPPQRGVPSPKPPVPTRHGTVDFFGWFHQHDLDSVASSFAEHGIDSLDLLRHLEPDHLDILIPHVGQQLAFVHAVRNMRKPQAQLSQLQSDMEALAQMLSS